MELNNYAAFFHWAHSYQTYPDSRALERSVPKINCALSFFSARRPSLSYFHQEVGKRTFGTQGIPSVAHLSNERGNVLINKCCTQCYRGLIGLKGPERVGTPSFIQALYSTYFWQAKGEKLVIDFSLSWNKVGLCVVWESGICSCFFHHLSPENSCSSLK